MKKTKKMMRPKNDMKCSRLKQRRIGFLYAAVYLLPSLGLIVRADEAGDVAEQFELARQVIVSEADKEEKSSAFAELLKLADSGHSDSAGALGYCYLTGTGTDKDLVKAIDWYRKGAEGGSAKAQLNYARYLMGTLDAKAFPLPDDAGKANQQKQEGIKWLRKSAAQKLPEAAADLGYFLYSGRYGLDKDLAASEPWIRIAAEAGDIPSQNILGVLYDRGFPDGEGGIVKDAREAELWYREAAMCGDRKAQSNLGKLLDPFAKDRERRIEALSWILLARSNKEPVAEKRMMEISPLLNQAELQEAFVKSQQLEVEVTKHLAARKQKTS